jgi:hypothetical protein
VPLGSLRGSTLDDDCDGIVNYLDANDHDGPCGDSGFPDSANDDTAILGNDPGKAGGAGCACSTPSSPVMGLSILVTLLLLATTRRA